MHRELIEKASDNQLKTFLIDEFDELKRSMPELYREMEDKLYEHVNGPHFTERKYNCAVSKMVNEDGTTGPHWKIEDISAVAKQKDVSFNGDFNLYDFAYVMNMMYSDYSNVVSGHDMFVKMSLAFLNDKDAPKGKAYLYYKAMKE